MSEPLLRLLAHVLAVLLIAVPLLWVTWRQHNDGAFPPWRTAAKVILFALIAWLVAYGIETLARQVLADEIIGMSYPSKRRLNMPMVERKGERPTPYPLVKEIPYRVITNDD